MAGPRRKRSNLKRKPARNRSVAEGKVRRVFWLDPTALAEAQAFLGTESERETVNRALELVAFRRDLTSGTRALRGMGLTRID